MGLLSKVLSTISGNNDLKISEQLLFDKVIGFKSIVPGCGASTILQNVAIALSESTKFNICVLDTNFLFPIQYPLLCAKDMNSKEKEPDIWILRVICLRLLEIHLILIFILLSWKIEQL